MQTAKELLMAAACFCYALVRGRAVAAVHCPKRVVIFQLAKLGDMVCTTPMFRALKTQFPDIQITVVGNATNKALLADNRDVDEYIVFKSIVALVKQLRCGAYDFGCTTSPSQAALTAMFLGNVRAIAAPVIQNGVSPLERFSYRLTRPLALQIPHRMHHYAPREYLRLLEPMGIQTTNTTKHVGFSAGAREKVQTLLGEHDLLLGIAPGAGNKIKQWPAERFAAVATRLAREHGATIVVTGSERDRPETDAMLASMKGVPVIDSVGISIDELKALIARLDLFVAADTGPVYIAEALDVPTVDITGPVDEREQPPIGERHKVVAPARPPVPQLFVMNAHGYDYQEARRQAEAASVEEVVQACTALLNAYPRSRTHRAASVSD